MLKVAALYVQKGGVYYGLPDVDPWDEERDARLYAGPWPVVAHPPCERWGHLWHGCQRGRFRKGDDGGCFSAALMAVRQWGGVLEHPADSSAWAAFGLMRPPRTGGWVVADWEGGWTCCVEQGSYGHLAPKATWLYAAGTRPLPLLRWGPSGATMVVTTSRGKRGTPEMPKKLRAVTPLPFRDLLLSMARSAHPELKRGI